MPIRFVTVLVAGLLPVTSAFAGGFNPTYLVPAYVVCPGPEPCAGTPQRESHFTFDSATLRSPRGQFADPNPKKPSFIVELKGVKDAAGTPVSGSGFTVHITTGQINLFEPTPLSFPAGHPLTAVPPFAITLSKGQGRVSYKPAQTAPAGTVAEGGAITVYDSDGKRLATVGSQFK